MCLQHSIAEKPWLHVYDISDIPAVLKVKQLQSLMLQELLHMFILPSDHVALALWNRRTSIYLTRLSTSATCGSLCRGATMLTLPMRSPCCLKSWSIFISILRVLKRFCLFASCANAALRQTRDYGSLLWFFKLIAYRGSHVSMAAVSNPNFRKVRFSRWLGNKLRKVPVLKRIFRRFSSCFYWRGARKWGSSLEIPPDQEAANNTALLSLSYLCLWCDDPWKCTICPLGS